MTQLKETNYWYVIFLVFTVLLWGCDAGKTIDIEADGPVTFVGKVNTNLESLRLNSIDESGLRKSTREIGLVDQSFKLDLFRENLMETFSDNVAFKTYLFGSSFSEENILKGENNLSNKRRLFYRYELFDQPPNIDTKTMLYTQILTPVDIQTILGVSQSINISRDSNAMELSPVGVTRIIVQEAETNTPIENANISTIGFQNKQKIDVIDNFLFAPVGQQTSDSGESFVYPIPITGEKPQYQFVVQKEGYCPFVSSLLSFSPSQGATHDVKLSPCETTTIESSPDLSIAFPEGTLVGQLEWEPEGPTRGLFTQNTISIESEALSPNIRSYSISLYQGDIEDETKLIKREIYPTFETPTNFILPSSLGEVGTSDGPFSIVGKYVYSDEDRELYGDPVEKKLFGFRSGSRPIVDASQISITSTEGRPNILSGRPGMAFNLAVPNCPPAGEIALIDTEVALDVSSLIYVPCSGTSIQYNSDDLQLGDTISELKTFSVFFKDQFKNTSSPELDTENVLEAFVDFDAADFSKGHYINFTTDLGFAPKGAPKGSDSSPYVFQDLKLTPSTVGDFVMRFSAPDRCRYEKLPGEGGKFDDPGNLISSFAINKDETTLDTIATDARCEEDLELTSDDLFFPANSSEDAYFWIKFTDFAGNASTTGSIRIPPCEASIAGKKGCWEN